MSKTKMIKVNKQYSQLTAYETILENIIKGYLKPGEVVTELSLSQEFGISRTPVREALKRLEVEGLIETTGRMKRIYYLSLHDIEEIFDLKIAIESKIAKKAASSNNKNLKDQLSDLLIEMNQLKDSKFVGTEEKERLDKWISLDIQFHKILFQLADNKRAKQLIERLNIQWHRIKFGIMAIEGRIEKAIQEHTIIGDTIIQNKPEEAAQHMELHLTRLKEFLIQLMSTFR